MMAYVPQITMSQLTDQYLRILGFSRLHTDGLEPSYIGFSLNYACIQWVEILPQPFRRKKLCVYLGLLPKLHEVCQPNRKPLGNLFGDTGAYPTISWLVEDGTGFEPVIVF